MTRVVAAGPSRARARMALSTICSRRSVTGRTYERAVTESINRLTNWFSRSGDRRRLVLELGAEELGVQPAPGQELGMPPALDDAAAVEHEDLVGVHDGRQPVGDDDGRAPHQGYGQRL